MKDYRIELKVRNNRILHYMNQFGHRSVQSFCNANDLHPVTVGLYVNLKKKAVDPSGNWTISARKLADALMCECDDLWTDAQRESALGSNMRAVEMSEKQVAGLLSASSPATGMQQIEDKDIMKKTLSSLTGNQEKVVRMRFGFSPYFREHTLAEVGKEIGLTVERVRQIQMKALRFMRHPDRSRKLVEMNCFRDGSG